MKHGRGKVSWKRRERKEGKKEEKKLTTPPKYVFADTKEVYDGEWSKGYFEGTGLYKYADGSTYEGEYVKDEKHVKKEKRLFVVLNSHFEGSRNVHVSRRRRVCGKLEAQQKAWQRLVDLSHWCLLWRPLWRRQNEWLRTVQVREREIEREEKSMFVIIFLQGTQMEGSTRVNGRMINGKERENISPKTVMFLKVREKRREGCLFVFPNFQKERSRMARDGR